MTIDAPIDLGQWSAPRECNTKGGPRRARSVKLYGDSPAWKAWRHDKAAVKAARFSLGKEFNGAGWELTHWEAEPMQFEGDLEALSAVIAAAEEAEAAAADAQRIDYVADDYSPLATAQAGRLFDWQQPSCQRIIAALKTGNAIDASQTGAGKTYVALAACAELGLTPYVIAPLAVLESWRRAAAFMGVQLGGVINWDKARNGSCTFIRKNQPEKDDKGKDLPLDGPTFEFHAHVRHRLDLFDDANSNGLLIFDECQKCLPYGALVLTDAGLIRIGEIVENRLSVKVACVDEMTGLATYSTITNFWENPNAPLITIEHEHGQLRCTEEHKIWTLRGWVRAGDVRPGDYLWRLPDMRGSDNNKGKEPPQADLRHQVRGGPPIAVSGVEGGPGSVMVAEAQGPISGAHGGEVCQPGVSGAAYSADDLPESYAVGGRCAPGHGSQNRGYVSIARGQRNGDEAASGISVSARSSYGIRGISEGGEGTLSLAPQELQSRPGVTGGEAGNRSGRGLSQNEAVEISGRQENRDTEFSRVGGITLLEPSGGHRFREVPGNRSLYDIEVADHHNYFADGVLVHNCKNRASLQGRIMADLAQTGAKCLALSATAAKDPVEMYSLGLLLGLHKGGEDYFRWAKSHGCKAGQHGLKFTKHAKTAGEIMARIHRVIFPARGSRIRSADVPGYPENHVTPVLVENRDIVKAYAAMAEKLELIREKADSGNMSKANKSSADLAAITKARRDSEKGKLDYFIEEAEELVKDGFQVAVFLNFREHLAICRERLKLRAKPIWGTEWLGRELVEIAGTGVFKEVDIDGPAQRPADRQRIIDDFNAGKEKVVLVSLAAGGAGISLHDVNGTAQRQSLISPSYSAVDLIQAIGRIWRAGGSKATQRIVFAAQTIEEEIAGNLQAKLANIETFCDGDLMDDSMAKTLSEITDSETSKAA